MGVVIRAFIWILIAISIFSINILAVTKEEINSFKERYGQDWKIEWNNITNTPHMIYGSIYNFNLGEIEEKEKAERIIYSFLLNNKDFFKIKEEIIRLSNLEEGNEEWYIEYQQYYEGLLVYNGKVGATLSKKGELISVGSDIYSDINISIMPQMSKENALQIAKEEFNYESIEVKNISLVVYHKDLNDYHLSWRISLFSARPVAGKEFFIDANTGEILFQYNTIISSPYPQKNKVNIKNNLNNIWIFLIIILIIMLILLFIKKHKTKKLPQSEK